MEKGFLKQLMKASKLEDVVVKSDFNYQEIWKGSTTVHRQCSRFLQCFGEDFLVQMVDR